MAFWLLPALLLGLAPAVSAQTPESTKDLAAQSQFVLRGTVRVLKSATVPSQDVSDLAVVRLDEVVTGPPMLKGFVGKDITVRLKDPSAVKEGEQRVFFANPWLFAESIGVVEVGGYPQAAVSFSGDLAGEVTKTKAEEKDRQLKAKLDKAPVVVAGRVAAVTPVRRPILTEHDPQWAEAQIDVTEVLKGSPSGKVTTMFPGSQDVMWFKAPKLKVGQEGVFLLGGGLEGLSFDKLGVVEPQDVLPLSEIGRVKALLGR